MITPPTTEPWLTGEAFCVRGDDASFVGFVEEWDRVLDVLASADEWVRWWSSVSRAPALVITVLLVAPPRGPLSASAAAYAGAATGVRRGRKRHRVQITIDPDLFFGLDAAEQAQLALPCVLDVVDQVVKALGLPPPPAAPPAAMAPQLPPRTLRKHRLRQLRGQSPPTPPARATLTDEQVARERGIVDLLARARTECTTEQAATSSDTNGRRNS